MENTINGYKEYEFGIIPKDWEIKKIGEIFDDLKGGSTPSRKIEKYYTGNIPWITSGELKYKTIYSTVENITEEAVSDTNLKIYVEGTFFIAITGLEAEGTRGSCAITGVKATTNQSCMAFQPKNNFSNLYLYYWYCLYGDYIGLQYTQGTKQQSLNNKIVSDIEIPVPELKEQQKIVSILSSIDEKIEITDNVIEKTKELKKGLMQRLFTKGIGHDRFKNTEIGSIPEDWAVKKLSEVSEFNNGKSHEKNISEFGDYIVVNSKFISTEGKIKKYTNDNICPLEKGDIVMVMSDLPNGKALGKCYLIETDSVYSLNQRICSLKSIEVDIVYLFYYLNRNKYFLKYDDGVKQTNLRKSEVLDCPVLIPCFNEQKQIASILSSIDEKIDKYESKKEKLQELKKGLMQKLLTGKIRVKV